MRHLLLAAAVLASAASVAVAAPTPADPCGQNEQFNFFELLVEAQPQYATLAPVPGAPPASVILTMDRCEVRDRDHVEGKPMTPTAERWYTAGSFGLILTTALDSDKTQVTVIAKRNGSWLTSGQLGEFTNMGLFDTFYEAKTSVKLAHYEQNGSVLPYKMSAAFRPSWSR